MHLDDMMTALASAPHNCGKTAIARVKAAYQTNGENWDRAVEHLEAWHWVTTVERVKAILSGGSQATPAEVPVVETVEPEPEEAPKPKRGRPKGSRNKPKAEEVTEDTGSQDAGEGE